MEVTRHEPYDFFIELTQDEFDLLKGISDKKKLSLEQALEMILSYGFEVLFED